jgi:hypothetical protein
MMMSKPNEELNLIGSSKYVPMSLRLGADLFLLCKIQKKRAGYLRNDSPDLGDSASAG